MGARVEVALLLPPTDRWLIWMLLMFVLLLLTLLLPLLDVLLPERFAVVPPPRPPLPTPTPTPPAPTLKADATVAATLDGTVLDGKGFR